MGKPGGNGLADGLLCGFGVFETMRRHRKRIVYLSQHLVRLKDSCKLIGLPLKLSSAQLAGIIRKSTRINRLGEAYVRVTVWRQGSGSEVSVIVKKYTPPSREKYRRGFSVCISPYRQNENSLFSGVKTISRILYELAFQQAQKKNFDEALILNSRGYLAEASRGNIFLVKAGEVFTPGLECGCLDGITRRVIFDLAKKERLKISEGSFTVADLYSADEAFLTNSLIGVMPLVAVEKQRIAGGKPGRVTKFFMEKYDELL